MIDYDSHRWTAHLFDLRGSVIREITPRVALCTLFGAAVFFFDKFVLTPYGADLEIPATVHTVLGAAIGLLLAFRTNSSYDRFWEGRKQWGAIVNETRNLARASSALVADPELVRAVGRWTVAFAWATKHQLRGARGLGQVAALLPQAEVREAIESPHPPSFVARRLSKLLAEARHRELVGDVQHMALDQNVQLLVDSMGACERIVKTPLPYAYAVHLRRAMIIFCWTLPFAIVHSFHWATIPATLLVAYTFFGIEEIGIEIENPFGHDENDLPLEAICETIERDVLALVDATPTSTLPTIA
jgi:ion channel-forming bestrophin family protein